jgi:hypothetical protein
LKHNRCLFVDTYCQSSNTNELVSYDIIVLVFQYLLIVNGNDSSIVNNTRWFYIHLTYKFHSMSRSNIKNIKAKRRMSFVSDRTITISHHQLVIKHLSFPFALTFDFKFDACEHERTTMFHLYLSNTNHTKIDEEIFWFVIIIMIVLLLTNNDLCFMVMLVSYWLSSFFFFV